MRSDALIRAADRLPSNVGRAGRVDALIRALPACSGAHFVESEPASRQDLLAFHSAAFVGPSPESARQIELVARADASSDELLEAQDGEPARKRRRMHADEPETRDDAPSPLAHDCPAFAGMAEYVREVAGASIAAARELREGRADVRSGLDGR